MKYYQSGSYTVVSEYRVEVLFDFGGVVSGNKTLKIYGYKVGTLSSYFSAGRWTTDSAKWTAAYNNKDMTGWTNLASAPNWIGNACPGSLGWYTAASITNSENLRYLSLEVVPRDGVWADGSQWFCDTVRLEGGTITLDAVKGLWLDVDSESGDYIYMTAWRGDDNLVLYKINESDLSVTSTIELGACTHGELGSDYVAYPYTPTFNASRAYVFGRMNAPQSLANPEHLIQTADGGATWQSKENGLGTSILTNFRAEGVADGARTFYGIVSGAGDVPKMYRGPESLAYISDLSLPSGSIINIDAFAIRIDPDTKVATIGVGNPGANSTMVVQSDDDGATWADTTLNLPTNGEITTCVFV